MNELKEKLRNDFYAKTDISVNISPENWHIYAEWLEDLAIDKINREMILKYDRLYELVGKVIEILEKGLVER